MTLVEFLLARIAEDEAWANARQAPGDLTAEILPAWVATRILAECEAKRRIVEEATDAPAGRSQFEDGFAAGLNDALRYLALPYADHPDYDEAWDPVTGL